MFGIGFNRFDDLRNKVSAAFELHGNIRPAIIAHQAFSDEPIIYYYNGDEYRGDQSDKNPNQDNPLQLYSLLAVYAETRFT